MESFGLVVTHMIPPENSTVCYGNLPFLFIDLPATVTSDSYVELPEGSLLNYLNKILLNPMYISHPQITIQLL